MALYSNDNTRYLKFDDIHVMLVLTKGLYGPLTDLQVSPVELDDLRNFSKQEEINLPINKRLN